MTPETNPAGTAAVIRKLLSILNEVASTPSNLTDVTLLNREPSIMTRVPTGPVLSAEVRLNGSELEL